MCFNYEAATKKKQNIVFSIILSNKKSERPHPWHAPPSRNFLHSVGVASSITSLLFLYLLDRSNLLLFNSLVILRCITAVPDATSKHYSNINRNEFHTYSSFSSLRKTTTWCLIRNLIIVN